MYQGPNYGRHTLLNPSFQNSGGLAAPSANARGGLFGPQGYGGGIFDGMSGMGTAVGQDTETGEGQYPWMKKDNGTFSLQVSANVEFIFADMPTIEEDGILGPQTCGALRYLAADADVLGFEVPATCQGFADYPESTVAAPSAPARTPGPDAREAPELERARSGILLFGIVALVASVGIGGYIVTQGNSR